MEREIIYYSSKTITWTKVNNKLYLLVLNVWLMFYDSVHLFFIPKVRLLLVPWCVNKVYKKEAVCKISDSTQRVIGFHFGPFRFFSCFRGT